MSDPNAPKREGALVDGLAFIERAAATGNGMLSWQAKAVLAEIESLRAKLDAIESAQHEIGGMEGPEHIRCGQLLAKAIGEKWAAETIESAERENSALLQNRAEAAEARGREVEGAAQKVIDWVDMPVETKFHDLPTGEDWKRSVEGLRAALAREGDG